MFFVHWRIINVETLRTRVKYLFNIVSGLNPGVSVVLFDRSGEGSLKRTVVVGGD